MTSTRATLAVLATLALVAVGCGQQPSVEAGAASPVPAETITVTETVTAAAPTPTEDDTSEPAEQPTGNDTDTCDELRGGEQLGFIFVTSPTPGQTVGRRFTVEGCSNSYEATYVYELVDRDGRVLDDGFGTASCGTGCVGDFSFTVKADVDERQVLTLRVFSESAEDGSEQDVNSIPVVIEP